MIATTLQCKSRERGVAKGTPGKADVASQAFFGGSRGEEGRLQQRGREAIVTNCQRRGREDQKVLPKSPLLAW